MFCSAKEIENNKVLKNFDKVHKIVTCKFQEAKITWDLLKLSILFSVIYIYLFEDKKPVCTIVKHIYRN